MSSRQIRKLPLFAWRVTLGQTDNGLSTNAVARLWQRLKVELAKRGWEQRHQPRMNIGLFGGTFAPIHRGHMALAHAAHERYKLSRILFVPANRPPHKQLQ